MALETEASDGLDIAALAFETGLSMEWVTDLCSIPLFYHRCGCSSPAHALLRRASISLKCRPAAVRGIQSHQHNELKSENQAGGLLAGWCCMMLAWQRPSG